MDSSELSLLLKGISDWRPFTEYTIRQAPTQPGVYVIRMTGGQRFGRLRGESDILYIGSTEAKRGLRQRLRQYLHPGPTQWTNKRVNQLAKKYEMEVAWYPCDEAGNLEHQLLRRYLEQHDELPPLNHASRKKLKKALLETIRVDDEVVSESFPPNNKD